MDFAWILLISEYWQVIQLWSLRRSHYVGSPRILKWVAIPFSREPFQPRDRTQDSALQVDSLPAESPWKPKSTELGRLSLLQWIFPTQELNQGLLHCRQILYQPRWKAILIYSLLQYCLICFLPWMSEVGRNLLLKPFYMKMVLYPEYIKNS